MPPSFLQTRRVSVELFLPEEEVVSSEDLLEQLFIIAEGVVVRGTRGLLAPHGSGNRRLSAYAPAQTRALLLMLFCALVPFSALLSSLPSPAPFLSTLFPGGA